MNSYTAILNLWNILYGYNRGNFIDNWNSDLIETGQILIIPPLENEIIRQLDKKYQRMKIRHIMNLRTK